MLKSLLARLAPGANVAIPDALWDETLASLPFAARLDAPARARLRGLCSELLAAKEMAGAGELELTAAIQVSIAIQACVPILELGMAWYRGWTSIVVYPGEFLVPRRIHDEDGVVHEYTEPISGEAWEGGPLVLSWADAQRAGSELGHAYNVVVHEFAHKLDMLDGEADGVPPFTRSTHPELDMRVWRAALDDALARFDAELELIEASLPAGIDADSTDADPYYAHLPIDPYAAQDPGEFFAVSSEAFFVDPQRLQNAFPDWYAQLARFYRQDPLAAPPVSPSTAS